MSIRACDLLGIHTGCRAQTRRQRCMSRRTDHQRGWAFRRARIKGMPISAAHASRGCERVRRRVWTRTQTAPCLNQFHPSIDLDLSCIRLNRNRHRKLSRRELDRAPTRRRKRSRRIGHRIVVVRHAQFIKAIVVLPSKLADVSATSVRPFVPPVPKVAT